MSDLRERRERLDLADDIEKHAASRYWRASDWVRIVAALRDADENARFRAVLEEIADEQKVYKGHGDYDIIPALTAEEAQTRARSALTDEQHKD